jgi:hypothetical protein
MADKRVCVAAAVCNRDDEDSVWADGVTPEEAARNAVVDTMDAYDPWQDHADDFERVVVYVDPVFEDPDDDLGEVVDCAERIEMLFVDILARMRADGEVSDD